MIIQLSEVRGLLPLNVLIVIWLLVIAVTITAIGVGVAIGLVLQILFGLEIEWLLAPVLGHPRV